MTKDEKIVDCEYKIKSYQDMLKLMPEDTLIGRMCINAYLKHEKKKLDQLNGEKD